MTIQNFMHYAQLFFLAVLAIAATQVPDEKRGARFLRLLAPIAAALAVSLYFNPTLL